MTAFARLRSLDTDGLTSPRVRLEYLAERHREPLRAACAADPDIWTIYPYSMLGAAFDEWWARETGGPRILFAVLTPNGEVIGTTSYLNIAPADATLEIGGTYIAPSARGTHLNDAIKRLLLAAAFAEGARRVEFRIDAINARSRGAAEKLGATLDGTLRQNRATWTGRVRDTCVYSILAGEWPAIRDRLDARLH